MGHRWQGNMSATAQSLVPPNPAIGERGTPVKLGVDPTGKKLVYASGRSIFIRNVLEVRLEEPWKR